MSLRRPQLQLVDSENNQVLKYWPDGTNYEQILRDAGPFQRAVGAGKLVMRCVATEAEPSGLPTDSRWLFLGKSVRSYIQIDPLGYKIITGDQAEVEASLYRFKILSILATKPNIVIDPLDICEQTSIRSNDSLRTHFSAIRRALAQVDVPPEDIFTNVAGAGYKGFLEFDPADIPTSNNG